MVRAAPRRDLSLRPSVFHLTAFFFSDIVPLSNWRRRRRDRKSGTQRGAHMVGAPCVRGGRYHSRAARDDRDGPARYSGHKAARSHVRAFRASVSRCALFATAGCSALRRKCRRAPPGLFSACARHCRPALERSALRRHATRFWQAGWDRGTYIYASPLTHSGVRRFLLCPVVGAKSAPFAAPLRGASHSAPLHLLSEPNPLRWASVRFGWGSQI